MLNSMTGKKPSRKECTEGEVLCRHCTSTNSPTPKDREQGKMVCKKCGKPFNVSKK